MINMTEQEALDYIREHLTVLHSNPNIYEDGTHNVIHALEDIVIPILVREIEIRNAFNNIFDKYPEVFHRVNPITAKELERFVSRD